MTRHGFAGIAVALLLSGGLAMAAEAEAEGGGGHELLWKWANFGLLAAGLGYLIAKNAPAFFRGRTEEIRRGIEDAQALSRKAEAKAAEIDLRMNNLQSEIDSLRANSRQELAAEGERVKKETAQAVEKLQIHGRQEIESAAKAAKQQLKAYSAELAIELAAQRTRERLTPATHETLVQGFVADLSRSQN
jgi:F-type H+-transporting ATPase subunit b